MNGPLLLNLALLLLALAMACFAVTLLMRDRRQQRSEQVIDQALRGRQVLPAAPATPGRHGHPWLASLLQLGQALDDRRLGKLLLAEEDRLLLEQIGHDDARGRALFLLLRLGLALLLPIAVQLWLAPHGAGGLFQLLGALAAGLLLPKLALRAWSARVRRRVAEELPLLVDLLRLLQGVGLSMDQSLQLIAEKFSPVLPLLGREIREANSAYMHGRPREQSLRHLAESFGNEDLQSLVQMILQVHQHGGAIQEPLRQFGDRLRERRKAWMKEQSGKLSVKMTVVMMLTLLPALLAVLAGPAIVSLAGTLTKLQGP